MTNHLHLIFPDGTIVSGASFGELEDALRASQWHTFKTRREFRREMRRRAALWSGRTTKPVIYQSSTAFILHLVHSGMCMLEDGELPTTPTTPTTAQEGQS